MVVTTKKSSDEPDDGETAAEITEQTIVEVDEALGEEYDEAVGEAVAAPATAEPFLGGPVEVSAVKRWALPAGVAALVLALVVATAVLGWMQWQTHQIDQAREQSQRAAVAYALVLTSIDSEKVDENFQQVLDGATGEFKDMYAESSEKLRQLLIDNKASANGAVVESAVQSVTKNEAVILLFVDQMVSNTNVPDPRLDRSRMKMTMNYVDGRWRASKVELP